MLVAVVSAHYLRHYEGELDICSCGASPARAVRAPVAHKPHPPVMNTIVEESEEMDESA